MAIQASHSANIDEINDMDDGMDTRDDQHNDQNNGNDRSSPENVEPTSSRRTTMIMRPLDQSEPPVDNPNNSPETNAQLRMEYERVKQLNHMMETVFNDLQQASLCIEGFHGVIDETDRLLDLWLQILSQTQHTKRLLEDPSLEKKETPPGPSLPSQPKPSSSTTPGTTTATTSAAEANTRKSKIINTNTISTSFPKRIRIPTPVGTFMTKRRKTTTSERR